MSKQFFVNITLGNDAIKTIFHCADLLEGIAYNINRSGAQNNKDFTLPIRDYNGNTVGMYGIHEIEEDE